MPLNPAKASSLALMNAAKTAAAHNRDQQAEAYLKEILRRNSRDAEALFRLGDIYARHPQAFDQALHLLIEAVNADPTKPLYKERFMDCIRLVSAPAYAVSAEQAVVECLKTGDVLDCSRMRIFWRSLLLHIPDFQAAFRLHECSPFNTKNKEVFSRYRSFTSLLKPYFLLGIEHIPISDSLLEEFLTHVRKQLLDESLNSKRILAHHESLQLALAIATCVFKTDYLFDITPEEKSCTASLREKIERGDAGEIDIALFACYEPLYTLANAADVLARFSTSAHMKKVVNQQIRDHQALTATTEQILSITPADESDTSRKVREQYEEFPYPRWERISLRSAAQGFRLKNERMIGKIADTPARILIAGCGTGQEALMIASAFDRAEILAVDLSRTSLAYAMKKADEYGIRNISFRQADLLRMEPPGDAYDLIISAGVLHHLEDPQQGWKKLHDQLKPGGVMMIALYSKIARRYILQAQQAAHNNGFSGTAQSMREFRRRAPELLDPATLKNISSFSDYYTLNMCRDMIFHVQEHNYDLAEIKLILASLDLAFLGLAVQNKTRADFMKEFPNDPSMTGLDNWSIFENTHPDTFRDMYHLWCRKPL